MLRKLSRSEVVQSLYRMAQTGDTEANALRDTIIGMDGKLAKDLQEAMANAGLRYLLNERRIATTAVLKGLKERQRSERERLERELSKITSGRRQEKERLQSKDDPPSEIE